VVNNSPQFVPDEVVVRMAQATPEAVDVAVGQTHGLQLLERSSIALLGVRLVRYRVLNNRPLAAALTALQGDPRVLGPQFNYYYRHLQGNADPNNGLQYALVKLDVARAQTVARGGGTLIAVIDSGRVILICRARSLKRSRPSAAPAAIRTALRFPVSFRPTASCAALRLKRSCSTCAYLPASAAGSRQRPRSIWCAESTGH
jgi:hypothetical protein